jgi:F0F1-type ATP synthase membrane subunit b/b'
MDARARGAELAALYRAGTKDIRAHFAQRQREIECERAQAECTRQAQEYAETQAQVDTERYSLRRFLTAYVEYLRSAGKPSANDVANILENHVFSDQEVSNQDAARVSTDDFVRLISKVVAAHGRTAVKLRSYL